MFSTLNQSEIFTVAIRKYLHSPACLSPSTASYGLELLQHSWADESLAGISTCLSCFYFIPYFGVLALGTLAFLILLCSVLPQGICTCTPHWREVPLHCLTPTCPLDLRRALLESMTGSDCPIKCFCSSSSSPPVDYMVHEAREDICFWSPLYLQGLQGSNTQDTVFVKLSQGNEGNAGTRQ